MTAKCDVCGGLWLDARYTYADVCWPDALAKRPTSLWRYEELLPFNDFKQKVSIGEGWTPIIRADGLGRALGHSQLFIKDERQSPTGSFKDRQGALSISILKQMGITECVLASTGNAAAAYAAYCARAGIKLWIFLTSMVPAEKMRELGLYGAEIVKVSGTYDQAKKIAADFAARRGAYFDRGARGVPGKESMKTLAFEIAEQLGLELADGERWIAPDWYLQAVSGGIGPLGVHKGFTELYQLGLIDKIPKLAIVQADGCAPMVQAFERGLGDAPAVIPTTRISVLATGDPGPSYTMLRNAILQNGGTMVSVDDSQAFRAMRHIARAEGLSVEPASAVAFAGLEKLLALGHIKPDETVLINCSGHTFPAEKHILEDQYVLDLEVEKSASIPVAEGLTAALERLDEQITKVLVIDDNPHDSRLIRRLLQANKKYRVFEANNPLDGLDLVRQRRPDLVITDLTMPQMDGFALLEQLKANPETAHIPVIVLSGKSLTDVEKSRLEGNIESVWLKGNFDTQDLFKHVVATLKDSSDDEMPSSIQARSVHPKLLVVDDNPHDSRLVKRILEAEHKFEIHEAHTGERALNAVRELHPDLVILDIMLPDMGGLDVLQRIRLEDGKDGTRHTKVAIMSAKDLTADERVRLHDAVFWPKATLDRRRLVEEVEKQLDATDINTPIAEVDKRG
jgi:threonine synthase